MRPLPRIVVHRRIWLRRVEGLVRVEFVDEEEEATVVTGVLVDPLRGRRHRARSRKVSLVAEVATRVVVWHEAAAEERRANPARVRPRLPRIALVPAPVVPAVEVGVI